MAPRPTLPPGPVRRAVSAAVASLASLTSLAAGTALVLALVLRPAADGAYAQDAPRAAGGTAPADDVVPVTIVHTNDLHGHVETFAAVAHVAAEERRRNPRTLFLDAGDCITGTAVSTVFQGTPVFDVMNAMGYDAGTIGNHEFDHGWERVHEFVEQARHPLLCANAADPEGRAFGDGPYRVLTVGGVRVGILGLLTKDLAAATTASATAGVAVERPIDAAKRLVPELRAKCDVLVALTHCGVEEDAALAGAVPGIDLVVGGHSHTRLERALDVGGARIVQAWSYGRAVGVIDLGWDPEARRIASFRYRLLPLDPATAPQSPEVRKAADSWLGKVAGLDEVIGRAPRDLRKDDLRRALERIWRDTLGADLGFQNLQGVRDVVPAGEIRVSRLYSVLPFDNTLVRVRVRGERLPAALRRSLGSSFDEAKEYVVATDSFVGDHRDRYLGAKGAPVEDTGVRTRDAAIDWVRKHGGFGGE